MKMMNQKWITVGCMLIVAVALAFGWVAPPSSPELLLAVGGLGMLDVFKGDAFSLIRMTDAVNKRPFVPGRLGAMGLFRETGMDTLSAAIEEKEGVLYLVPAKARGSDPTQNQKENRKMRLLAASHLPVSDRLMADEVQGVRAFGSENQLESIQAKVNEKLDTMVTSLQATLEHMRIGAVKGIVMDADGTTPLYNLFTEFGITPPDDANFDFGSHDDGYLRQLCADIVRRVQNSLGAASISGVHAICGDSFFDALLGDTEVRESYKGTPMAQVLREGFVYPNGLKIYGAFEFGGIVFENYRGSIGGTAFVATDVCHLFPMGVPDLFRIQFAPANYVQTVNTIGLPIYAKTTADPKDRWVDIDVQSNPLPYCTRPRVLIRGISGT